MILLLVLPAVAAALLRGATAEDHAGLPKPHDVDKRDAVTWKALEETAQRSGTRQYSTGILDAHSSPIRLLVEKSSNTF